MLRGKEFIPVEKISSVDISSGIIPSITIHTTVDIISLKSDTITGPHFDELFRELIAKGRNSVGSESNSVDALEKLAHFFEKGVLTEEEFKSQKAKIISS